MVDNSAEFSGSTSRFFRFFAQVLRHDDLLDFDPFALAVSDESVTGFRLIFDFVEIVNDDTDKQVDYEQTANHHESDKVQN